ncbi:ABC transporter permease [Zobellia galactanivorans]|uniref:ABC transporter permease n=1 Tax=Zobellia galactanivorans (strain DSM 12802 / CCUG 47099 / CIP 106680 / NCIMB 13871 / Dsij) TaxID=63186 RepID=UPI001C07BE36|nr:ABC transporter permease [Zobellia galactanivorans]MBU3024494.1 ABC transporter permease [Zobellia galactanivorans]MDO6807597.1 ABC transporter permease [Zobellia galactanivorans]
MLGNWGIYRVFKRELLRLAQQKSVRNLFIIVPLLAFFILGAIYYKGALRELPIAVYDNDNSSMSRTYIRFLEASPTFKITHYISSDEDIERAFVKNDVEAVFYIPKDFYKNVLKKIPVQVKIYSNSTNIVFGNLVYRSAVQISQLVSASVAIKRMAPLGIDPSKISGTVLPIQVNSRVLGNPQYNYSYYLIPGLSIVLLQMIVFIAASRAFNNEWKNNTFQGLVTASKGNFLSMLFGKYLAFLVYGLSLCGMVLAVLFPVFGIPVYGNIGGLMALLFLLITVNIFLGFGLSLLFKNELIALDLAIFYNSPAFVFSGFTFPIWAMPWINRAYADIIPFTHFLTGFLKIYQLDTPVHFIWPEIGKLLVFLLAGFILILGGLTLNGKLIFPVKKIEAI